MCSPIVSNAAATPSSSSPKALARIWSLRRTAPTCPATSASPTGPWLRDHLVAGLSGRGVCPQIKYLDPSYEIRALPANAYDAAFCLSLGQMAAHAGLAGKTDIVVGYHHNHFTHVPIKVATSGRRQLDPNQDEWQRVLQSTGQPRDLVGR